MADVTSTTYTTNFSETMKEDILDMIINISPEDTIMLSSMGRTRAKNTLHQWPQDELAAPINNAVVEGADVDAAEVVAPTLANNYTQISDKVFKISDTAERVDKYGRKSEAAYQFGKKLKELGRDMEKSIVNNKTAVAGDASTARQFKGIEGFITTNSVGYTAFANTNTLTEELLNDAMEAAWTEGGDVDLVILPPKSKREASQFDGYNQLTKNIEASTKKAIATIDFYNGDFGDVALKAHRYIDLNTNTGNLYSNAYVLETDLWKMATLGDIKQEELSRNGHARKYMISVEYTIESRQEKGNAKITNLFQKPA